VSELIDISKIPPDYAACSCRSNARMGLDLAYHHHSSCPNFNPEFELVLLADRYLRVNQERLQKMSGVVDRLNQRDPFGPEMTVKLRQVEVSQGQPIRDYALQTVDAPVLDQRERLMVQSAIDAFSQAAWGGGTIQTEDGENLLLMQQDLEVLAEVLNCVNL
jgi:hypothetical protein